MATRIKEAGNLNTLGYAQLRQQFNAQFNKNPLVSSDTQRTMYSSHFMPSDDSRLKQQLDYFKKANEPLQLSMYDMKEESEDMLSVDGTSSDFETVCDSDTSVADFESVESYDTGINIVLS